MSFEDAGVGFDAPTADGGADTGSDSGSVESPISRTYVVSAFSIPDADDMGRVPGFNLDSMNSDGMGSGCVGAAPDYMSWTGEVGTDNQFVGSFNGILGAGGLNLQMSADEQIASGAQLLAMRVNDIDSFTADADVTLELFLVRQAVCVMSPCPLSGGVVADQAWRQDALSVTATPSPASIEDGQLRGGLTLLPLSFSSGSTNILLTIHDARVGAVISATGLTNGAIGGTLRADEIINDVTERIQPGSASTARPVIDGSADLEPTVDPNLCASMSIGIGFTAVPAMSVAPL